MSVDGYRQRSQPRCGVFFAYVFVSVGSGGIVCRTSILHPFFFTLAIISWSHGQELRVWCVLSDRPPQ